MSEIVTLVGVVGSGKTYQRDLLVKKGYVPLDFKDDLIDMVEDLVGFEIRDDYERFKQEVIGLNHPADEIYERLTWQKEEEINRDFLKYFPLAMTGRRLLQRLGTEVMRKRDPDYWTNAFKRKATVLLRGGKNIVCADCRFENEVEVIRRLADLEHCKFRFVFCNYKSARYDAAVKHESEKMAQVWLSLGYKDLDEVNPPKLIMEDYELPQV